MKIKKIMFLKFTISQKMVLIITIISFFLVLFPFKKFYKKPDVVVNESEQSKRIELLEFKIKKFEVQRLTFDSTIKVITDSIVFLQYEIEKKEMQILNLKRKKHETNIVVRNFNDSDIVNFFANRYK
jgi:hypothetical protein